PHSCQPAMNCWRIESYPALRTERALVRAPTVVTASPSASVPCVAGSSPSRATLPSVASPYSQVIRPFLEKSCHPSEKPTYPALDLEKPESLRRQRAVSSFHAVKYSPARALLCSPPLLRCGAKSA